MNTAGLHLARRAVLARRFAYWLPQEGVLELPGALSRGVYSERNIHEVVLDRLSHIPAEYRRQITFIVSHDIAGGFDATVVKWKYVPRGTR